MVGALALTAAACTPRTAFRQTTRVGHVAPPTWTGAAAEPGEAWAGGTVEMGMTPAAGGLPGQRTGAYGAVKDDPGLLISALRGGVHVRGGLSRHVELGARASINDPGSEAATRFGVLPTDEGPSYAFGPNLGLVAPVSDRVDLVTRMESQVTFLPYTRYGLTEDAPDVDRLPGDGAEYYEVVSSGVVRRLLWSGSMTVVWNEPKGNADAHAGMAISEQITNNGFSDNPGDPAVRGVPAVMFVAGGAGQYGDLRVGLQAWVRIMDGNNHGAVAPMMGLQATFEGRLARGKESVE